MDPVASAKADQNDESENQNPPSESVELSVDAGDCRRHGIHLFLKRFYALFGFALSVVKTAFAVQLRLVLPHEVAVSIEPSVLRLVARRLLLFKGSQGVRVSAHPLRGASHARLVAAMPTLVVLVFGLEVIPGRYLNPLPGFPGRRLMTRQVRRVLADWVGARDRRVRPAEFIDALRERRG